MADRENSERLSPRDEDITKLAGPAADAKKRGGLLRRSVRGVGWLLASPAEWFGFRSVHAGATSIGRMYKGARAPRERDRRFRVQENGDFDRDAIALNYGITIGELERRLAARRRQTALLAYGLFGIGCLFVLGWIWVAVDTESSAGRFLMLLRFIPFCALFYLMAFYNALINFQIRTERAAGWLDYISTEEGFMPR